MSRHSFRFEDKEITLGVDRPLHQVFAQILLTNPPDDADDESAPGFDPFSYAEASLDGLQEMVDKVEAYFKPKHPNFKVPFNMRENLKEDLTDLYQGGNNLNYQKSYGLVTA
jgi:hypothetical protein